MPTFTRLKAQGVQEGHTPVLGDVFQGGAGDVRALQPGNALEIQGSGGPMSIEEICGRKPPETRASYSRVSRVFRHCQVSFFDTKRVFQECTSRKEHYTVPQPPQFANLFLHVGMGSMVSMCELRYQEVGQEDRRQENKNAKSHKDDDR